MCINIFTQAVLISKQIGPLHVTISIDVKTTKV